MKPNTLSIYFFHGEHQLGDTLEFENFDDDLKAGIELARSILEAEGNTINFTVKEKIYQTSSSTEVVHQRACYIVKSHITNFTVALTSKERAIIEPLDVKGVIHG